MIIILDALGAAHPRFPFDYLIKALPEGWGIGVFDTEFGGVIPRIRLLLQEKFVSLVRVHIFWGKHALLVPLETLKSRLPLWEKIARDFPATKIYISHTCEHWEKNKAPLRDRMKMCEELAPSCCAINCPDKGAAFLDHWIDESHTLGMPGEKGRAGYAVSADGVCGGSGIFNADVERWLDSHRKAEYCGLWGSRFNLRYLTKDGDAPPPPPLERTAAPSPEYIQSIIRLGFPKFFEDVHKSSTEIPVKAPLLWKSHSEDSPPPKGQPDDRRSNKPVFLCDTKASSARIVTVSGKFLGRLAAFGEPTPEGLTRYYAGLPGAINLYGYQIGERARNQSGKELVWLEIAGKTYGPINPAFRQGGFIA